ncbi:MAG: hypothetical protein HGA31_05195 [Candidatus Moranbacteria bacterium]|nr:hypothetical protein [Candidatus Moranbacteria bacterium]
MIKTIHKTEEINARLEREGKVTVLDKPEHLEAIRKMNEQLERVRREYMIKSSKSEQSAAKVILTC